MCVVMGNTPNHYEALVSKNVPVKEVEGVFHLCELHVPTAGTVVGGILLFIMIILLILFCGLKYRKGFTQWIQQVSYQQQHLQQPLYNPPPNIYQTIPTLPVLQLPSIPMQTHSSYNTVMSMYPTLLPIPLSPPMPPNSGPTSHPMLTYKVPDNV